MAEYVSAIIDDGNGNLDMQVRTNGRIGTWGGKVEPGETEEHAMRRELGEEIEFKPKTVETYNYYPTEDGKTQKVYRIHEPAIRQNSGEVHEGIARTTVNGVNFSNTNFAFDATEDIVRNYLSREHSAEVRN
jgi:hypothetical protein